MSDNNPQQASVANVPVDLGAIEQQIAQLQNETAASTNENAKREVGEKPRRKKRKKKRAKATATTNRKPIKRRKLGRFAAFKARITSRPERTVIFGAVLVTFAFMGWGVNLAMSIPTEAPASVATVIEDAPIVQKQVKTESFHRRDVINESFEVIPPQGPPEVPAVPKSKQKNQKKSSADDGSYQLASFVPVRAEAPYETERTGLGDVEIELPQTSPSADDKDDPLKAYASARAYVAQTATPGGTMTRQGREKAVECLHPEFVLRLANAIKEARNDGMQSVGVYSACRPPAFGVGGFRDKFNSLHAYGLAVDVHGIGRPGSSSTKNWHAIAKRHGVVCPYGPNNRAEFNHCQPTNLKIVQKTNPLRNTITKNGPIDLERMWAVAKSLIVKVTGREG